MSGNRSFFVPCTVCGKEPSCWRHDTDTPLWAQIADPEVARRLSHGYQPDETSVEWAAVKMREALNMMLTSWAREQAREKGERALELADAAGIRSNKEGG